MRVYKEPVKQGDVVTTRGGNGGVISQVVVTDKRADGRVVEGGAECRQATPQEVKQAIKDGNHRNIC